MILNEAIYTTRKMYYHISTANFDEFKAQNNYRKGDNEAGGVFLTPNILMIRDYTANYLMDKFSSAKCFYLYRCMLNKELNIFNPINEKDRSLFLGVIQADPEHFIEEYTTHSYDFVPENLNLILKKIFQNNWTNAENPAVVRIIKSLGYDGYESTENTVTNVLIFDPKNVKMLYTYDKDGDYISPYWKKVPNDPRETKEFFNQFNKEIQHKQSHNSLQNRDNYVNKKINIDYLSQYKKSEIFGINIIDDDSEEELYHDEIDNCFDSTGKLITSRIESLVTSVFNKIKELQRKNKKNMNLIVLYDNIRFSDQEELLDYVSNKYETTEEDPGDEADDWDADKDWDDDEMIEDIQNSF